jgi:hypothetical protein
VFCVWVCVCVCVCVVTHILSHIHKHLKSKRPTWQSTPTTGPFTKACASPKGDGDTSYRRASISDDGYVASSPPPCVTSKPPPRAAICLLTVMHSRHTLEKLTSGPRAWCTKSKAHKCHISAIYEYMFLAHTWRESRAFSVVGHWRTIFSSWLTQKTKPWSSVTMG